MCRSAQRVSLIRSRQHTMAESSAVTNKASKRVQPEGLQEEAHLLGQLAEVPTMSKVWIREDATDTIMHFTVKSVALHLDN